LSLRIRVPRPAGAGDCVATIAIDATAAPTARLHFQRDYGLALPDIVANKDMKMD
jgi:hypothetical protein